MEQQNNGHYDFFIAHAGKDINKAKNIYDLLSEKYKVFLDKESLQLGDNWPKVLSDALEKSKVIILLLSKGSDNAYYLQEEMVRAIQLQRTNSNFYKVVPIYLDGLPNTISEIPYGLYQLHSIDLVAENDVKNVYKKLVQYFDYRPSNESSSYQIKEDLHFSHVLHKFPIGPRVDGSLVPVKLIEEFAETVNVSESLQIIDEANALRKQADPSETGSITIKKINLPHPGNTSPKEFWLTAFVQARLHGPRMLAALLLSVEDTFFSKDGIAIKNKLLKELENHIE